MEDKLYSKHERNHVAEHSVLRWMVSMLFNESENILSHKLHFQNKNAWVLQALSAKEKHRLIDTVPHFLALENSTHWKQLQNTKQTIFFCNTCVSQWLPLPTFPLVFDFCMRSCRNLCCLKKNLIKKKKTKNKKTGGIPARPSKSQVSMQLLLTSHIDPILQSFS